MRRLTLTAAATAALCCATPKAGAAEPAPEATIALEAWGLTSIDELRHAQIGVLATEPPRLVVYHLGKVDPRPRGDSDKRAPPPMRDGVFLVAPLAGENQNILGGFFNGFARAPATAEVTVEETGAGAGERALAFRFDKGPGTFAGFWVHLFETRASPAERIYLDARGARWLTFEVRGDSGGEPVRLQIADQDWEKKQDSSPIDDVAALIDDGRGRIETHWRRAWLDLDRLDLPGARLDRSRLASLVFLVDPEGQAERSGRIWVRGVALTEQKVAPVSVARERAVDRGGEKKAMWLWETRRILDEEGELERLAAFAKAFGLTDLFVQIPYLAPKIDNQWSLRWDEEGMSRLILALSGVRVHALDGAAFYARPQWHERPEATVSQIAAFNRKRPPAEGFAGVRFDVEPYLLPEWQGEQRERVLRDYVTLLERLASVARAGGLTLGVDIPFWFDGKDELTGRPAAPLDGKPVLERVLDLADDIGLMDYRTMAFGADGVIAHGSDELALASARGKRVFIGLETVPLPDERLLRFEESPLSPLPTTERLVIRAKGDGQAVLSIVPAGVKAPSGARVLAQRESVYVPADKITFANHGREALERVMSLARPALAEYPSFQGFVLHSYESLAPWYR